MYPDVSPDDNSDNASDTSWNKKEAGVKRTIRISHMMII